MSTIKQIYQKQFDSIISLNAFAFQFELTAQQLTRRLNRMKTETIFGSLVDDQIAAKVHIIPFQTYVNGKRHAMGGISGVVTLPEFRRQGLVKQLLKHSLAHMYQNGQTVSFLYPFAFPFYRKFGWELISMKKEYTIPMERLRQRWNGEGYMRPSEHDIPLLHKIYTQFAKQYNGMLERDTDHWSNSVLQDNYRVAIAYHHTNQPEGYIIYQVKKNILTVKEYAYTSLNGQKLILQFIANHDSMADQVKMQVPENDNLALLLPEPRFEQQLKPQSMARIVNVPEFLRAYTFAKTNQSIHIELTVEDSFLPENSGTYHIRQTNEQTHVTFLKDTHTSTGIRCSIQQLAAILLGFKRPTELYQLNLIQGNIENIEQLECLIPNRNTCLMDFF